MKKKTGNILVVIFIIIIGFIFLNQLGVVKMPFAVVPDDTPTPNYAFAGIKEYTNTNNFTCDYDECLVYGVMNVEKGISKDTWTRVGVRCSINFDTEAECRSQINKANYLATNGSCSASSGTVYSQTCVKTSSAIYTANFNFCPLLDQAYAFCTGSEKTFSSEFLRNATTSKKKLKIGESLKFNPEYPDRTKVVNNKLIIESYDGSCYNQIQKYDGTACSTNEPYVLCKPQMTCPAEYTLLTSGCAYCNFVYTNIYNTATYKCWKSGGTSTSGFDQSCYGSKNNGWGYSGNCLSPTISSNTYSNCIANAQTINGVKCGAYESTVITDNTGKVCISKSNNQKATVQEVGTMGCVGSCSVGSRTGTTGGTTFTECVNGTSCPYLTSKSCPANPIQLYYDDSINKKDCVFSVSNHCTDISQTECSSDKMRWRKCDLVYTQGLKGQISDYQWDDFKDCSTGELKCGLQSTTDTYPSCGCKEVNEVKVKDSLGNPSDIKCVSESSYLYYNKGTDANSCYKYRVDTNNLMGFDVNTQKCVNNEIVQRTDIGCSFPNNPASESCREDLTDSNNIQIDKCDLSQNICKSPSDSFTATSSDYSPVRKSKCGTDGLSIFQANKYEFSRNKGTNVIVYRYEKNQSASCTGTNFCVQGTNIASCSKCSELKDSRGTLLESKSSIQPYTCVLANDIYSAISSQKGNTKCDGNTVYYVKDFVDSTLGKTFYRWEIKTDASNSVNGVCSGNYFCKVIGSTATCSLGSLIAISSPEYGVGEIIDAVKVELGTDIPNYQNAQITIRLLHEDGTAVLDSNNAPVLKSAPASDGKVTINLGYAHNKAEKLQIKASAGGYDAYYILDVRKKIRASLTCPSSGFINKEVVCTFKITERGESITSEITIPSNKNPQVTFTTQPTLQIITGGSPNSFKFFSPNEGIVQVKLSASADGYISDSQTTPVSIQGDVFYQTLLIDEKDFTTYLNGIPKGERNIALKLEVSGEPANLSGIQATIENPSGFIDNVPFIQDNTEKSIWSARYNFVQPGYPYKFSANAIFKDETTKTLLYTITPAEFTEDIQGQSYVVIALVIAGVLGLVIVIIVIAYAMRKKKRMSLLSI